MTPNGAQALPEDTYITPWNNTALRKYEKLFTLLDLWRHVCTGAMLNPFVCFNVSV